MSLQLPWLCAISVARSTRPNMAWRSMSRSSTVRSRCFMTPIGITSLSSAFSTRPCKPTDAKIWSRTRTFFTSFLRSVLTAVCPSEGVKIFPDISNRGIHLNGRKWNREHRNWWPDWTVFNDASVTPHCIGSNIFAQFFFSSLWQGSNGNVHNMMTPLDHQHHWPCNLRRKWSNCFGWAMAICSTDCLNWSERWHCTARFVDTHAGAVMNLPFTFISNMKPWLLRAWSICSSCVGSCFRTLVALATPLGALVFQVTPARHCFRQRWWECRHTGSLCCHGSSRQRNCSHILVICCLWPPLEFLSGSSPGSSNISGGIPISCGCWNLTAPFAVKRCLFSTFLCICDWNINWDQTICTQWSCSCAGFLRLNTRMILTVTIVVNCCRP